MAFLSKISNEEVASLEAVRFDGQIVIIETEEALERACQELAQERVLGFDTETRPSFKAGVTNKVALLQLSTYERCYLIRLCRVKFSSKLQSILQRSDILKIGADVAGDLRSLGKLRSFTPRGFVDLQSEVTKFGIEDKSLRKMSGIILGKRVSKAQRLSNWEAQTFTDQQKMYAATDAWVCLKIFDRLKDASPIR
ncbi:MAG: 3'-5' exonuclease domain-containing protein 2 [Alistipes sp.]|nr:3'-5' exonuclease domain-containing protein 2 [Alistipes sp.]